MSSNSPRKQVKIYTDGSCSKNPGPGGWAAIMRYNNAEREISGGAYETTNNRMEVTAAIEALNALKEPCDVTLYSDSKYLIDAVEKKWLDAWRKKGWKKSDNKPVLNIDLWEKLLIMLDTHNVNFVWVKGHNEHPENERCDALAVEQTKRHSVN